MKFRYSQNWHRIGLLHRTPFRFAAHLLALGMLPVFANGARSEPAIGQFEIKSLDADPGEIEFQSQNAYSFGQPRTRNGLDADGEHVGDGNSIARQRHALEVEYSFSTRLKGRLGIEYEKERSDFEPDRASGTHYDALKLDEYAAELIWVAVPREGDGFGLGAVLEFEYPTEPQSSKTLVAGPIFEWGSGAWLTTFNPMLVQHFGGERNDAGKADEKVDFAYTARILYEVSHNLSWAIEAYGTIERVGSTGAPSDEGALFGDFNQHRVGPVVYWTVDLDGAEKSPFRPAAVDGDVDEIPAVTFGFGVLQGLNASTPDTTLKLSIEAFF